MGCTVVQSSQFTVVVVFLACKKVCASDSRHMHSFLWIVLNLTAMYNCFIHSLKDYITNVKQEI